MQTNRQKPPYLSDTTSVFTCNVCVLQQGCRHRQKPRAYLSDGLQVALGLGFVQKVPQLLGDAEPLTGVIPNAVDELECGVGLHSKLLPMRHTGQPQHNASNSEGWLTAGA